MKITLLELNDLMIKILCLQVDFLLPTDRATT